MRKNIEIGRKGELDAQKFLIGKGYNILATNFGNKHGEIDIIANLSSKNTSFFLS